MRKKLGNERIRIYEAIEELCAISIAVLLNISCGRHSLLRLSEKKSGTGFVRHKTYACFLSDLTEALLRQFNLVTTVSRLEFVAKGEFPKHCT